MDCVRLLKTVGIADGHGFYGHDVAITAILSVFWQYRLIISAK
jgi:hypothetical protein